VLRIVLRGLSAACGLSLLFAEPCSLEPPVGYHGPSPTDDTSFFSHVVPSTAFPAA
jgi:hypothetical protein